MFRLLRSLAVAIVVASLMAVGSVSTVFGVELTGSTSGCFGAACTPVATPADFGGLHFSSATFTHDTSGPPQVNLGSFLVSLPPVMTYNNVPFTLLTAFSSPATTPASSTALATISGTIFAGGDAGSGFVTIDFDNTPRAFVLNSGGGSFTLTVADLTVPGNGDNPVVGTITFVESPTVPAPVPEPTTLVLLASGIVGAVTQHRLRRRPG